MHELRQRLGLKTITSGDVDTIGGLITQELGRFPRPGDEISVDTFQARVLSVQKNRVTQVLLWPTKQPDTVSS